MHRRTQLRYVAVTLGLLFVVLTTAGGGWVIPAAPHVFFGEVTVNNSPANSGLVIQARLPDNVNYTHRIVTSEAGGSYGTQQPFQVCSDNPTTLGREGGINGELVEFFVEVGGRWYKAGEAIFNSGSVLRVDLSVSTAVRGYIPAGISGTACTIGDESESSLSCGDVDRNGKLNVGDAIVLLQIVVGKIRPTIIQMLNGDVDGNAVVNIIDAVIELQHLVELIPVLDGCVFS